MLGEQEQELLLHPGWTVLGVWAMMRKVSWLRDVECGRQRGGQTSEDGAKELERRVWAGRGQMQQGQ